LTHVREVSLLGAADLAFWKEKLAKMDLLPVESNGKAQLLIVATDARFMGVKFRELSFSVQVLRLEDGMQRAAVCLIHAFNSSRLFAFCERKFFSTPYYHADIRVSTSLPALMGLVEEAGGAFRAEMEAGTSLQPREPARQGDEVWEGPIIFGHGHYTFFARLKGRVQTFTFVPDRDSIMVKPSSDASVFQALIESNFIAKEWVIREDAMHAKSKTYERAKMLASNLP
jgi:hypothetical protein